VYLLVQNESDDLTFDDDWNCEVSHMLWVSSTKDHDYSFWSYCRWDIRGQSQSLSGTRGPIRYRHYNQTNPRSMWCDAVSGN
jgi:hypothetical protein